MGASLFPILLMPGDQSTRGRVAARQTLSRASRVDCRPNRADLVQPRAARRPYDA
jgi:hypothetical protein